MPGEQLTIAGWGEPQPAPQPLTAATKGTRISAQISPAERRFLDELRVGSKVDVRWFSVKKEGPGSPVARWRRCTTRVKAATTSRVRVRSFEFSRETSLGIGEEAKSREMRIVSPDYEFSAEVVREDSLPDWFGKKEESQ